MKTLSFLFGLILSVSLNAQFPGTVDKSFATADSVSFVRSNGFELQSDGRAIVYGDLGHGDLLHIARLNLNGTLDPSFIGSCTDKVNDILCDKYDHIFVGGKDGVFKLLPNGEPDPTFSAVKEFEVNVIGLSADNGVYISQKIGEEFRVSKLKADGSPDTTFKSSTYLELYCIKELSNGEVLVACRQDFTPDHIIKLDKSGERITSFNTFVNGVYGDIYELSDGGIIISRTDISGFDAVFKLKTDGNFDPEFELHNDDIRHALVSKDTVYANISGFWQRLDHNGRIDTTWNAFYIGGTDINICRYDDAGHLTSNFQGVLVKYNPLGETDTLFIVPSSTTYNNHYVDEQGRIYCNSYTGGYYASYANTLKRLHPDGSPDTTFPEMALWGNNLLTVASDGSYFVDSSSYPYNYCKLKKFDSNGQLVPGFAIKDTTKVGSLTVLSNGQLLASIYYPINNKFRLRRLNSDGTYDLNFTLVYSDAPMTVREQADGKYLIKTQTNGTPILKRYLNNGAVDTSFFCQYSGIIRSFELQSDGKIVLVGESNYTDYVLRLNSNGKVDNSFQKLKVDIWAHLMTIAPDDKIICSVSFKQDEKTLLRLMSDGREDPDFIKCNHEGRIATITASADAILLSGELGIYNSVLRNGIFRLHSNYSPAFIEDVTINDRYSLYPVPATSELNWRIDKVGGTLKAISIDGKESKLGYIVTEKGLKINVESLPSGVYVLSLSDGEEVLTQRFVK